MLESQELIKFLDNYKNLSQEKTNEFLQKFEDFIAEFQKREKRTILFNEYDNEILANTLDDEKVRGQTKYLYDRFYSRIPSEKPVEDYINTRSKYICMYDKNRDCSGTEIIISLLKAEMKAYFDDFFNNKVDLNLFSGKYDKRRLILENDYVFSIPMIVNDDFEVHNKYFCNQLFDKKLYEYESAILFFMLIDNSIKSIDDFYNNRKYILEGLKSYSNLKQRALREEANRKVKLDQYLDMVYKSNKDKIEEQLQTRYIKNVNKNIEPEYRDIFNKIAIHVEAYYVAEANPQWDKSFGENRAKEKILDSLKQYYMNIKEFK